MIKYVVGYNGGGDRLEIDIDEFLIYGISLKDIQEILCIVYPVRESHAQEKRIWVMYRNKPIAELGVCEIKAVLKINSNLLNDFQKESLHAINEFIADHKTTIIELDENLLEY